MKWKKYAVFADYAVCADYVVYSDYNDDNDRDKVSMGWPSKWWLIKHVARPSQGYHNSWCLSLLKNIKIPFACPFWQGSNNQQPKYPTSMYNLNMPHPREKGLLTVRCSPCTYKLTAPEKKTNSVLQWAPCSYSPYVEKVTSRYIWTNVSVLIQESRVSCCKSFTPLDF